MAATGNRALCDRLPFLTCRVGNTWFAVPAVELDQIVSRAEGLIICSFPGTVAEFDGENTAYLVSISQGKRVGFIINEVGAIRTFPAGAFYSLPQFLRRRCHRAFWGIGFVEGCTYILLELSDIDPETIMEAITNLSA